MIMAPIQPWHPNLERYISTSNVSQKPFGVTSKIGRIRRPSVARRRTLSAAGRQGQLLGCWIRPVQTATGRDRSTHSCASPLIGSLEGEIIGGVSSPERVFGHPLEVGCYALVG